MNTSVQQSQQQIDNVNRSSAPAPPEIDEFALVGMDSAKSHKVKPWRFAASRREFECGWIGRVRLKGVAGKPTDRHLVLGEVVGVHFDDCVIENGAVDVVKLQSPARCGEMDLTWVEGITSRDRPTSP